MASTGGGDRATWIVEREAILTQIAQRQRKPPGCRGCPLESRPFVPWQGRFRTAPIILLGEGPGGTEPQEGRPFAGRAGARLDEMLASAGLARERAIARGELAIWNAFQCAPPTGETLDPSTMTQVIKHCRGVFLEPAFRRRVTPPKVVITLGNAALQSLTNQRGIMRLRGKVQRSPWLPDVPILPTVHPAAVLRDPALAKLVVPDLGTALTDVAVNGFAEKKITTSSLLVLSGADLVEAERELARAPLLGVDFETTGLTWDAEAVCVALSSQKERAWVFPFRGWPDRATVAHAGDVWAPLVAFVRRDHDRIAAAVRRILLSARRLAMHNAKHDLKFTYKTLGLSWWTLSRKLYDTLVMQSLIDENLSKKLDDLTPIWTTMGRYKDRVAAYTQKHPEARANYANVPPGELVPYCAADADATRRIAIRQIRALRQERMLGYYVRRRRRLLAALLEGEFKGLLVDQPLLDAFVQASQRHLAEIEAEFRRAANDPTFSVRSNPQLQALLFQRLELPVTLVSGRTGQPSLSRDALVAMQAQRPHPLIDKLLDFRAQDKLNGTYGVGLRKFIGTDGRIHPNLAPFPVSGRLSCRDPNLQNLPRDDKGVQHTDAQGRTRFITPRRLFIVPKGWVMGVADFSQIELRCAAVLSGDPVMLQLFREERDIHLASAAMILQKEEILEGTPAHVDWCRRHIRACRALPPLVAATKHQWERWLAQTRRVWRSAIVLKAERSLFKTVVFGKLYGASNWRLAQMASVTEAYIDDIFNRYWARFAQLKQYLDGIPELIREERRLVGTHGLIRRFPGGIVEKAVEGHQERQGINFGPQNSAAEITNESWEIIQETFVKEKMRSRLVLTVHDNLLAEIPNEELKVAHRIIVSTMTRPIRELEGYRFPVSVGYGRSMYDAESRQKPYGRFERQEETPRRR